MKRLQPGWFLEGPWDEEYQRYRLLAYLKEVSRAFMAQRLYPPLGDLIATHAELVQLAQVAPAPLSEKDDTLQQIIHFALPRLEKTIEEGRELYELILQQLQVEVVGVVPLYKDEGYVLLRRGQEKVVRAYRYELRRLYDQEGYLAIRLQFQTEFALQSIAVPLANLRERLLIQYKDLPVPFTLAVESPWEVPLVETLLPILQRSLPGWIASLSTTGYA